MFNQKDGCVLFLVYFSDNIKNLFGHKRGQSHGWFIKQQELWSCHQRPGDGKHLLLSPGQVASRLIAAFLQNGEEIVNIFKIPFNLFFVFAKKGSHVQVFRNRQVWKNVASFRNLAKTQANNFIRT